MSLIVVKDQRNHYIRDENASFENLTTNQRDFLVEGKQSRQKHKCRRNQDFLNDPSMIFYN